MSAPQAVTLGNVGTTPLTINAVTVAGSNAPDFGMVNNCPTVIPPHALCVLTVTFDPALASLGSRSALLVVADDAPGSPQTVSLSGAGGTPAADITPHALSFEISPSSASTPQSVTLTNVGTIPLTISNMSTAGAEASTFHIVDNSCPTVLAPNGGSCIIVMAFDPSGNLACYSAMLVITDDAPGSPHTVGLKAYGGISGVVCR